MKLEQVLLGQPGRARRQRAAEAWIAKLQIQYHLVFGMTTTSGARYIAVPFRLVK